MSYIAGAHAEPKAAPSALDTLAGSIGDAAARISAVTAQLHSACNAIHGPRPTEVGANNSVKPAGSSLRARLDDMLNDIGALETAAAALVR